jgi:UDP-GlcNAc:undecaprenyl-phosphate GlcNAc-1-phosphate transferase
VVLVVIGGYVDSWPGLPDWWSRLGSVLAAALIVLLIGFVDDTRALGPRIKLLGQSLAVLVLWLGGIRIEGFDVLGLAIELSTPSLTLALWGHSITVALPSLVVTLSGSLFGFLLYNWHPACIFLGDSGSLLIGLLIGVIGVQGSFKGPSAISILFPILAMGLPISDTAMAIFRRWVRNLPLSSADRRHVHHLLIGLGLNPRQAALLLYCFSGFLCGVVLLGVALRNEVLALILAISGCLAFLLVLTTRLDELSNLRGDFFARLARSRQERFAARITWEAIQRIELCEALESVSLILDETTRKLGCELTDVSCSLRGKTVLTSELGGAEDAGGALSSLSGPSAVFRLSSGHDLHLAVSLHQSPSATVAADIAFRFLQRLALATAERLQRLLDVPAQTEVANETHSTAPGRMAAPSAPGGVLLRKRADAASSRPSRPSWPWLLMAPGGRRARAAHHRPFGEE